MHFRARFVVETSILFGYTLLTIGIRTELITLDLPITSTVVGIIGSLVILIVGIKVAVDFPSLLVRLRLNKILRKSRHWTVQRGVEFVINGRVSALCLTDSLYYRQPYFQMYELDVLAGDRILSNADVAELARIIGSQVPKN